MKNIKNLTILKTTNTLNFLIFYHGKKIIAKIGLEPPTTKIELLFQIKKEYAIKVQLFEEGICFYTTQYDKWKLSLNRKLYAKYSLKLAEVDREFKEEFKKEFKKDINFNIFND